MSLRSPVSVILVVSTIAVAVACNEKSDIRDQNAAAFSKPQYAPAPMVAADTSASFEALAGRPARPGVVGGMRTSKAAAATGAEGAQVLGAQSRTATAPQQEVAPGTMLVRVGQASLQVESLEVGIARVRDVARRTGAVIANTSMEGGRNQTRAASLELRIPSERFDEAVNGLSPIGKVESVNVSVQDVGEEYVDVQARVANARRLEQRLVELLANRTGKLSDVLTVERELARVREEIERYEGRMRYLRSRASVSTLSIAVHEPYPIVAERPGTHPMRDAFVQAWRNLIGVTAGVIASLGVVIPLGIIIGAAILVGRRVVSTRAFRALKSPGTEGA